MHIGNYKVKWSNTYTVKAYQLIPIYPGVNLMIRLDSIENVTPVTAQIRTGLA